MRNGFYIISICLALVLFGCGDGSSGESSAENTALLSALLSWDDNSEMDLNGYKIYYGTVSDTYTVVEDVGLTDTPDTPQYTVTGLESGITYYFAVTAYDTSGNDSDFSNEVSKLIGS